MKDKMTKKEYSELLRVARNVAEHAPSLHIDESDIGDALTELQNFIDEFDGNWNDVEICEHPNKYITGFPSGKHFRCDDCQTSF